jgi:hypothetical protein
MKNIAQKGIDAASIQTSIVFQSFIEQRKLHSAQTPLKEGFVEITILSWLHLPKFSSTRDNNLLRIL